MSKQTKGKILTLILSLVIVAIITTVAVAHDQINQLLYSSALFFLFALFLKGNKTPSRPGIDPVPTPSAPAQGQVVSEINLENLKLENPQIYSKYRTYLGVKRSLERDMPELLA